MKSAVLRAFGPAATSLAVEETAAPAPGAGEVLVRMLAAPINPADINIIEGRYGELPDLPAVIGNEGSGTVERAGDGVAGLAPGDRVCVLKRGTWTGLGVFPATDVERVPSGLDPLQAAMLAVNPPTAALMLREFANLAPGDWVAQNAANSAVGRSVIQLARARGLRTLNVVRRAELAAELEALGASVVVTEDCELRKEAKALCNGSSPKLGLNAVGGSSALNIAGSLAPGATLVTYGAMGLQPLKIPNALLIFRDLRFVGFWLTRWKARAPRAGREALLRELAEMAASGALALAVHRVFPLADVHAALEEAAAGGRSGKVLLDMAQAA